MKQTIRFRGLSLNKDEMSAEHGELSLCGNLELHDGALRPYQVDGEPLAGGDSLTGEIIYVHVTASYRHFITKQPGGLYWSKETEMKDSANHELYVGKVNNVDTDVYQYNGAWYRSADYTIDPNVEVTIDAGTTPVRKIGWKPETQIVANTTLDVATIRSIKSVGNTLCILNSDGLHYILCKNSSGAWSYSYLGQQPPFLELQFNLELDTTDQKNEDDHFIAYDGDWFDDDPDDGKYDVKKDARSSVTDQVLSKINHRIDKLTNDGYFYAPFMVRYCYRLEDGSMFMHSAPVLMFSLLTHPVLTWIPGFPNVYHAAAGDTYYIWLYRCKLQACCVDTSVITALQDWSDIVKSVDIFITPQFSRINTAETIDSISLNIDDAHNVSVVDGHFRTASELCTLIDDYNPSTYYSFDLPEYEESEYISRIKNASSFFKLCSYKVDNLPTEFAASNTFYNLKFDSYILSNIAVQEQMTDDWKTHNLLLPEENGGLYVYNHRLNVYSISERLFGGFSPRVMFPYADTSDADVVHATTVGIWVHTDKGMRYVSVSAPSGTNWPMHVYMMTRGYLFYPDSRAVRMKMSFSDNNDYYRNMEDSIVLNGAFSFWPDKVITQGLDPASNDAVPLTNKIYTSKADNPFYFPNLPGESGINSVGTGEIIGIAAVTRPLVQGEVGKQNLVVFATDGIWVCEVSSTGTYSSMRNISREVCVNQESICQMDQSILFATNRSLSRFVESDVISVSDVLDGPIFDIKNKMAAFDAYADAITLSWGAKLSSLTRFATPPLDFFREGKELYDYTGMRVIVFPKDIASGGVSLVYSIRDGAWSTIMFPALKTVINSYPSPYIQRSDGGVFCLNQAYDYKAQYATYGVIVTRTLSFSDTMDVLRGFRQYTDSAAMPLMFFYGSNDQRNWKYIGQTSREYYNYLPGHPYRFFRIGIFMNMYPSEEYQALELETVNKYAKL